MRIVVIGGSGFLGSVVVRQLASHHEVISFHRGHSRKTPPQSVQEVIGPDTPLPITQIPAALVNSAPDVVIHIMAFGQADARACMHSFRGHAGRLVLISSGDVYRAYGRLIGIEPGLVDNSLLSETAPLRSVLFPYRSQAKAESEMQYWYEKILAEGEVLGCPDLPGTVLRLPKMYGPGSNDDLATVYRFRDYPLWRWTHGYVENVAAAICLAATNARAEHKTYNVGEAYTPTVAERVSQLPECGQMPGKIPAFNFDQNIAFDTTLIRNELTFRELIPEDEAMLLTLERSRHQ